jgi:hypothetical protein
MARVRLGLGRLSVTDKVARGRHIVTKLTNNTAFPNPHPALSEVTTALDELEAASAQVQSAKSEVTTRIGAQENAERRVDQILARLGSYVESVAGTDDTLITAAGMDVKSPRTPASVPLRLKVSLRPRESTKARSFYPGKRSRTHIATSLSRVSIPPHRRAGPTWALQRRRRKRLVI